MGNLFAYFLAVNCIDPLANRWQLRNRKKKCKNSLVPTYTFSDSLSLSLCGTDTDSIESSSYSSICSLENPNEFPSVPDEKKLGRMYVPYIEPSTSEMCVEQTEMQNEWMRRYKLFFPRNNRKIVIDGSYPLGGNVFDALKSCPFTQIDVEFRFLNLALFDGESWNSFCTRVKHLKLYKCRMDSSILFGIAMNGKSLTSLRLVMPLISKFDLFATRSLVHLASKKRPTLETLTFCGSDVEIFEPFLTLLFSIYTHVVDLKICLKVFPEMPTNKSKGKINSNAKICNAILNRIVTSPKKIRSLDLRLFDKNLAGDCKIIPIVTTLFIPELTWLTKMGFYLHHEMDYDFFQTLDNLSHLRAIKWLINFNETGSFTFNCCVFSLTSFPKLRSLKIVHSKCFPLEGELLELLTCSQLQKLHINADKVRVDRGCENCPLRPTNSTLRQLKVRVNHFNLVSDQVYEVNWLMKILVRTFDKLEILHYAPVKDTVMEDIIQYQQGLEELNVELYNCSYNLFSRLPVRTKQKHIRAICEFKNLKHLTITDVDGRLNLEIFSFITSERIKSLKLFGCRSYFEQDELVEKYFRKFRELSYFQYNSCLYIFDPFIQCPRKIFYLDVEKYVSDDYAEGDFKLIDLKYSRGWFEKLKDQVYQ